MQGGRITVSFPYDPQLVAKVKTIEGRKPRWNFIQGIESYVQKRKFSQCIIPMASHGAFLRGKWHKDEKYWSFPDSDVTLEKILKVFEGEEIHLDPALKGTVPDLRTEQSGVVESGLSPRFEDLRRELVSRKYSCKTVKGYLYYNKDFNYHCYNYD